MMEDWKVGCVLLGGVAIFLAVIAGIGMALESAGCRAKFEGSGLQSDWGIISGCRVNVPGQGWIPAANYRVL